MSRAILAAAALAGAACAQPAAVAPPTTTTTAPPVPPTAPATAPTTSSAPPVPAPPAVAEGMAEGNAGAMEQEATLACIRHYESRGNYRAVSRSGRYRGAYQFDRRTYESNGGTGDPAAASPAEQDRVAGLLLDRRGLAPWPTPERRCG